MPGDDSTFIQHSTHRGRETSRLPNGTIGTRFRIRRELFWDFRQVIPVGRGGAAFSFVVGPARILVPGSKKEARDDVLAHVAEADKRVSRHTHTQS